MNCLEGRRKGELPRSRPCRPLEFDQAHDDRLEEGFLEKEARKGRRKSLDQGEENGAEDIYVDEG